LMTSVARTCRCDSGLTPCRLRMHKEARAALAEASQLIIQLNEDPNNNGHHDQLIAEILFREAKLVCHDGENK
jgi:hypothetical protein